VAGNVARYFIVIVRRVRPLSDSSDSADGFLKLAVRLIYGGEYLEWLERIEVARLMHQMETPALRQGDRPPDAVVREELARILSSDVFTRSDRLSAFLRFIVEKTLNGEGDSLKEHVLAVELYGKAADFNAAADPIVRVDARRLRDKLREYYASAPHDDVLIGVPKGSYTPVFEVNPAAAAAPVVTLPWVAPAAAPIDSRRRSFRRVWVAAAGVVVIGAMVWVSIRMSTRSEPPPIRLLTVTSFPGSEGGPAFSPDGSFVAFVWSGPDFTAPNDLWVKAVDGDALRRLTDTPGTSEGSPAWSPDGRQIAFNRFEGEDNRGVYVISALGGSERKVTDWGVRPTWLPDSQSLVFQDHVGGTFAPVHYVLATGVRRQLTTPPAGFIDVDPSVSPDGKTVAFVRSRRGQAAPFGGTIMAALFVVPMAGGDPVRVDDWVRGVGPPEWTPDSREIFYPRWEASGVRVFRIAVTGGPPVPAAGFPNGASIVSISGFRPDGTFRVAMVEARNDVGLRMIDVQAPQSSGRISAWTAFCDSTRVDWPGRFSRDGAHVSFTSDRSGLQQVLAASRDGSQVRTLTAFEGSSVGLASWSPDGQSLVFDAVDDKNLNDLFVAGAAGGLLRRLTHDDKPEINPEWSRDGKRIYYASDISGRPEIWKIPAAGGEPVQLTMQGGLDPRESPDGRSVYFLEPTGSPWATTRLKRVSVEGGNASTVLSGLRRGAWDVVDTGIVFLTGSPALWPDPATPDALELYSFKDERIRRLGELPFLVTGRGWSPPRVLTVSPDGRWVVVSHQDHWARDIVVADNYR
jgi:Tol biopolymer transport system component